MSYKNFTTRSGYGRRQHSFSNARPNKRQRSKENIHPSRFISPAKNTVDKIEYTFKHSFDDFAVNGLLKNNLKTKGITVPSAIQDQAIPFVLEGRDVIGIANTGTGKTIAFALPALNKVMSDSRSKVLVMAPTRELASQILDECKQIGRGSGIFGALLIGGAAMNPQLRDLHNNPKFVIGTPGRIKDHIERGSLDITNFDTVVLDEVDRMLDMGFVHDMRDILGNIKANKQSLFFSATLDERVDNLIRDFANNPVKISVKTGVTTDTVEQNIIKYQGKNEKVDKLHDLLISDKVAKALIFDETQRSVEKLSQELISLGFKADAIHGGKSQGQRQRALQKFKRSEIKVLVATDVAARGLDVHDISHVINYSTPQTYDDYVHRIGRAGRAGRTGYALTFIEA